MSTNNVPNPEERSTFSPSTRLTEGITKTVAFALNGAGLSWKGFPTIDLSHCKKPTENFVDEAKAFQEKIETWVNSTSLSFERKKDLVDKIMNCKNNKTDTLNLSGYYSLPSISAEIFQLTHIHELDLSLNRLPFLPPQIGQLTQLQRLNLSVNQLSFLPPEICQLTQLQWLNLSNNLLSSWPPQCNQFVQLRELYLSYNHLPSLPSQFGQFAQLKYLELNHNSLSSLPPQFGRQLVQLRILDLEYNQLSSIPNEILQLSTDCNVYMDNNHLSETILANLRTRQSSSGYRGPRIYFSTHEESESDTRSVEELWKKVCRIAEKEGDTLVHLLEQRKNLHSWLSRLSYIGDYKPGGRKRTELAQCVVEIMTKAENEEAFRETFFSCIDQAAQTCGDRMALSLLYLGINYQIAQSIQEGDLKKLAYLLGHGTWALNNLQEIARAKVETLYFVDEIEVYLALPIKLKDKLQLPIILDTMLYFGCSSVTEGDLKNAEQFVTKMLSNREAYLEMLAKDETWQRALKTHRVSEFKKIEKSRDTLSEKEQYTEAHAVFAEGIKALTQEVLKDWHLPLGSR